MLKDPYQSTNYWFSPLFRLPEAPKHEINTAVLEQLAESNTWRSDWVSQHSMSIPAKCKNFEAQWFFDSWLSKAYGKLFEESGKKRVL